VFLKGIPFGDSREGRVPSTSEIVCLKKGKVRGSRFCETAQEVFGLLTQILRPQGEEVVEWWMPLGIDR